MIYQSRRCKGLKSHQADRRLRGLPGDRADGDEARGVHVCEVEVEVEVEVEESFGGICTSLSHCFVPSREGTANVADFCPAL
ncbi:hypothetical protein [Micromonospora zamorensis]|uniref:hypothetical protein n=1 Tax=Micromonospora zamorensis TaxID=709883 RepID=UPI0033BE80EF